MWAREAGWGANYCKSGNLLSLKERLEDIELEIW